MTPIGFIVVLALLSGSLLLIIRELQIRALNARIERVIGGNARRSTAFHDFRERLSSFGMRYRRVYSEENLEQLRIAVQSSGFNPHRIVPVLVGTKILSVALFPALAAIISSLLGASFSGCLIVMALALALGIVAPRLLLKVVGSRFNTAIQRGTPDMIDLLIICSEAGMGLESALERVAQEMGRSNAPMSKVLNWLLDDLRMLPNRRDAFGNLASRTTSEGLRRFGTMVNQSLQYGTPLGDALRAIAEELRRDRMTSLEERAHKLGAKLIVPMVIFILPAMFVTLAGSSFLHLIETFKNIGHLH
ncbi:MAG TPA: type II secretion system F family protein [Acetobacteraceae bacterium]|nr:type II secretion system F family protein [Acetobacteraceae bacterium]